MQVHCRKCGGNHFTIKCGIDEKGNNSEENIKLQNPKVNVKNPKTSVYKVKITDFPPDISEEELLELLKEWGPIKQVKLLNYKENSTAYIEFSSEIYAKHFVNALHNTTFDTNIIHVSLLIDKRK
jgi:RNA recognition motif-containing protein